MSQAIIFQPVIALLILTAAVWLWMFVRRMAFLTANKIDAERLKTPQQIAEIIPANVAAAAHNFKNLFEVPVLYYMVCTAAYALNLVDGLLLNCAWAFVILRLIHSLVHCTYNRVMHRFIAYLGGCVVVWFMLGKLALQVF